MRRTVWAGVLDAGRPPAFRLAPGAAGGARWLSIVPGKWRRGSAALRAIARQCTAETWRVRPKKSS